MLEDDEQHGVAVARRARDLRHADVAAGAGDVLDVELLAELLRQLLRDQPSGDVGHAARRERHDDLDRLVRILLRECRARSSARRRKHAMPSKAARRTATKNCHDRSLPTVSFLLLASPRTLPSGLGAGPACASLRDNRAECKPRRCRSASLLQGGNALKIGLFGANCSSGRAVTKVPERWSGTWPDNLTLARMADEAGIDFMLPIGRWKGYGGDTGYQEATLETMTWACGLLAATKRITVFGTVHAPLFHPIIAAKQMVTADHIGEGRFGLNIVVGWNEGEFEMFGVEQREHETRYEYAQEWIDAIKLMWSDRDGLRLRRPIHQAEEACAPSRSPIGGTRPVIMNAGASPVGPRLCGAQLRRLLHAVVARSRSRRPRSASPPSRPRPQALGREIGVFTVGVIICRPTMKEAEDYHHHVNVEQADWSAVDQLLAMRNITPRDRAA